MERERLIYPLVRVHLETALGGALGRCLGPSLAPWIMRAGFVLPVLFPTFNALRTYLTCIPYTYHPTRFDGADFSHCPWGWFSSQLCCGWLSLPDEPAFSVWFFNNATDIIR